MSVMMVRKMAAAAPNLLSMMLLIHASPSWTFVRAMARDFGLNYIADMPPSYAVQSISSGSNIRYTEMTTLFRYHVSNLLVHTNFRSGASSKLDYTVVSPSFPAIGLLRSVYISPIPLENLECSHQLWLGSPANHKVVILADREGSRSASERNSENPPLILSSAT